MSMPSVAQVELTRSRLSIISRNMKNARQIKVTTENQLAFIAGVVLLIEVSRITHAHAEPPNKFNSLHDSWQPCIMAPTI